MVNLTLTVGSERLVIARLNHDENLPNLSEINGFFSITKTPEEISVIIPEEYLGHHKIKDQGNNSSVKGKYQDKTDK